MTKQKYIRMSLLKFKEKYDVLLCLTFEYVGISGNSENKKAIS